mgnify:CR=1 FL=1
MRALGIILAGGNSNKMGELSAKRAVAAMPITGGYRAIDFALSNMTNSPYPEGSGIYTVQYQISE